MNNEFKKLKTDSETRYVLESMTAGATGAGSIATASGSVGKVQKRGNILAQEAGKDKEAPKPRNFVAKNAKMGGAGKMKDKSKTLPRKEKHKKPVAEGFNHEYDDEAGMAHSNLLTTARAVMGLLKTIKDRDNLPEWGQEKIAKAEMMLVSVWDYLQSQKEMGNDPQQGVAEGEKTMSRAAKGNEKYGKDGMKALAKAGRDGASEKELDAIRDKHDNYNEGVAGPKNCWPGYRKTGTQPGTGKNAGKRVNDCEKIKQEAANPAQQAAIAIAKKKEQGMSEAPEDRTSYQVAKILSDRGIKYDPAQEDEMINAIGMVLVKELNMSSKQARHLISYDEDFVSDTLGELGNMESSVAEVAPPGWEKTVKAMKKYDKIDNPYALAWSMKNKGYKSHKKESTDPYFESLASKLDQLKKK
jgi:hypothetical protein